ncbi:MAG: thioredoxin family protein [Arcobacteraceae bacterium]|nr:thioredoxin family protein [Arcobacteraceae bacterium]
MKIVLVNIFLTISLFASQIQWSNNYHMSRQKAKKANKDVFLFISSVDNPFCEYMEEDVFKYENVVKYINKDYIAVRLVIEKDKLPRGIKVLSAPSMYFLTHKGKKLYKRITGEIARRQLIEILKEIQKSKER